MSFSLTSFRPTERLGLTRQLIKDAFRGLGASRQLQVILCSILRATRFKNLKDGGLLSTTCKRYQQQDSFEHVLICGALTPLEPKEDPETVIGFLAELAGIAMRITPGLPIPRYPVTAEEISLSQANTGQDGERESRTPV